MDISILKKAKMKIPFFCMKFKIFLTNRENENMTRKWKLGPNRLCLWGTSFPSTENSLITRNFCPIKIYEFFQFNPRGRFRKQRTSGLSSRSRVVPVYFQSPSLRRSTQHFNNLSSRQNFCPFGSYNWAQPNSHSIFNPSRTTEVLRMEGYVT